MFRYFTDLEICLVSEKNLKSELLLIFNFRNPSFSSYRFRLGGLGRSGLGRCVFSIVFGQHWGWGKAVTR